jgi:hypothetical protein
MAQFWENKPGSKLVGWWAILLHATLVRFRFGISLPLALKAMFHLPGVVWVSLLLLNTLPNFGQFEEKARW